MKIIDWLEYIDLEGFEWIAKRLSGNDTGLTGGHQAGLYLPKEFFRRSFPEIVQTDELNPKKRFETVWLPQTSIKLTEVTATYYNNKVACGGKLKGTRNEFRLTRWSEASKVLQNPENTGALMLLAFRGSSRAEIWICSDIEEETEVESWLGKTVEPGQVIFAWDESATQLDLLEFSKPFEKIIPPHWYKVFPTGAEIFSVVQKIVHSPVASEDPDQLLLKRRSFEFELFSFLEQHHVFPLLEKRFSTVNDFVELANKVTNRRKARSGRSLELGLQAIFTELEISFETQVKTEGKSSVDFLFPSLEKYRRRKVGDTGCVMLAAKTCCKDRWRQITKEAKKLQARHLFTLQQGVSPSQFTEMKQAHVTLVVPKSNFRFFPASAQKSMLSLLQFTKLVQQLPA